MMSETAELKCTSCFILTNSNINNHMWLVAIVLNGAALREILRRSSLRGKAGGSHKYVANDINSAGNYLFFSGRKNSGSLLAIIT